MTPKEQKAAIRNERLALRDAMTHEARIEGSLAMVDHAGDRIDFEPGTVISGFWPIRSEADIRPLMAHLRTRGARLCLPVVLDRETIVFRELAVGAVHPTAEGHAAMADATVPAAASVLKLDTTVPEVISQPVAPLPTPPSDQR